jgi:hypothetical protein
MLSDYFGDFNPPNVIAAHKDWYTPDGLVLWSHFQFQKFAFDRRYQGRNDDAIQACIKDPNRAVLLQVDNGQHWVVALSKTIFGNDYVVADPWFGDKRTACGTYKNITGFATFKRL